MVLRIIAFLKVFFLVFPQIFYKLLYVFLVFWCKHLLNKCRINIKAYFFNPGILLS